MSQCPPPGEAPSDAIGGCIAEGQSCRFGQPGDCCSGTVCRPNSDGVRVCQTATSSDLALSKQCARVAKSKELRQLELLTPTLRTSIGTISLPSVSYARPGVGPNGCLNAWQVTLGEAGSCGLDITTELQAGKLVATWIHGNIDGCPGAQPNPNPTSDSLYGFFATYDPAIDPTFQGLACDTGSIYETYCVAGTFDFHIRETKLNAVGFEDQHLIVRGGSCSASPEGACPSP